MVTHRKVRKNRYLVAAIVALLIFCLGVTMGLVIDNERVGWVSQKNEKQEIAYQSLQLQYLYLNTVLGSKNESCDVLHAQLEDTLADLGFTLDKLNRFKEDSSLNKEEYKFLKRKFLIDNLEYWLFARKAKKLCNTDLVSILYFYSGKHCPICPDQGVVLTYFKKKYEERLLIFPIDVDMEEEEPMIRMLRRRYDVYNYPTIVVEGKKYEGVIPKEQLGEIICDNFKNKEHCK